jgi:predicted acyltransferase
MVVARVASLDLYRGWVMFLMMAEVLRFGFISQFYPESSFWRFLSYHQDHVPWAGCSLHDLIQPSFSFLVGVVVPFSLASRNGLSDNNRIFWQTLRRSFLLIFIGIFLRSMWSNQTYFTFEDTLTQIGLGYGFLVVFSYRSTQFVINIITLILVSYFLCFVFGGNVTSHAPTITGVDNNWMHNFDGFMSHWNKNSNFAWQFDRWFLNIFPRETAFLFNEGGYVTLSFIPTLTTMLLGLLAGRMLYSGQSKLIKRYSIIGISLIIVGILLHLCGICPIVKRIWTPSWVLFSGGFCFLFLVAFEILAYKVEKKWYFFFTVLGANSITAYVIAHTTFIGDSLKIHLGQKYDQIFGEPYQTLVSGSLILLLQWLILRWMYQRKIFIKV